MGQLSTCWGIWQELWDKEKMWKHTKFDVFCIKENIWGGKKKRVMGSVNFIQSKSKESAEVMQMCWKHNKHR